MNICYHLYMFDNDKMTPFCLHCGHIPKENNKAVVKCPECGTHQTVDINVGVECNYLECMAQFEAFDAERVEEVKLKDKMTEKKIEAFFKDVPF